MVLGLAKSLILKRSLNCGVWVRWATRSGSQTAEAAYLAERRGQMQLLAQLLEAHVATLPTQAAQDSLSNIVATLLNGPGRGQVDELANRPYRCFSGIEQGRFPVGRFVENGQVHNSVDCLKSADMIVARVACVYFVS
jgi:hypothetical protein